MTSGNKQQSGGAFRDHFSGHSDGYSSARPSYPPELFAWLASLTVRRGLAWDCATGNGQAATSLARHFLQVHATDASAEQIHRAPSSDGVEYAVASAEYSGLESGSVDLITVAQALHWFDFDSHFAEVNRVLRPEGAYAAWCYGHNQVSPEIDAIVLDFYHGPIDDHWPPERIHIEDRYSSISFPMEPIECPGFEMTLKWTADDMLNYMRTWSATVRCHQSLGRDPIDDIEAPLREAWKLEARAVQWPLHLLAGRLRPA